MQEKEIKIRRKRRLLSLKRNQRHIEIVLMSFSYRKNGLWFSWKKRSKGKYDCSYLSRILGFCHVSVHSIFFESVVLFFLAWRHLCSRLDPILMSKCYNLLSMSSRFHIIWFVYCILQNVSGILFSLSHYFSANF